MEPRHFLFVAGALRERSSEDSAELQLGHGLWGLRTSLIRENLRRFRVGDSRGLVYVLKAGIRAEFEMISDILDFASLDDLLRDELRDETRHGFIRIKVTRRWDSSPDHSQSLLLKVLDLAEKAEFTRRLSLGMHGLTQLEYEGIVRGLDTRP